LCNLKPSLIGFLYLVYLDAMLGRMTGKQRREVKAIFIPFLHVDN
jgi:hypothetical protein